MFYFILKSCAHFIAMFVYGNILCAKIPKRKNFIVRIAAVFICFVAIDCFVWRIYPDSLPGNISGILRSTLIVLYYLIFVVEIGAAMLIIYKNSLVHVFFVSVVAHLVSDFSSHVLDLIKLVPAIGANLTSTWWLAVLLHIVLISACAALFNFILRKSALLNISIESGWKVFFIVGILFICLVVVRFSEYIETTFMSVFALAFYGIITDVMFFCIIFFVLANKKQLNKNHTLSDLLRAAGEQGLADEEIKQQMNIFAHDWRNRRFAYELKNGDNLVDKYDLVIKTGNPALDIILNEKSAVCSKKGITFKCMINGEALSFIEPSDICALIGNILDNAIEACMRMEEQEFRYIELYSYKAGGIFLNCENSIHKGFQNIDKDGNLQTEKEDKALHGFGMISIRNLCQNYNGMLKVNADGDIFRLTIYFER